MKKILAFFALLVGVVAATQALKYELSVAPNTDADKVFAQYCGKVDRISTDIPYPNYSNVLVKKAAANLNTVAPVSFYMYSGVVSSYGFRKGQGDDFPWEMYQEILEDGRNRSFGMKKDWDTGTSEFDAEYLKKKFDYQYYSYDSRPPQSINVNGQSLSVNGNTHAYLVYLCGEFRDRPTLIEEKLKWLDNMIKLPAQAQNKIDPQQVMDSGKSIWQYVTGESYAYYVTFSRDAFAAKEDVAWQQSRYMKLSDKWTNVDKPVPAFTVCEVKYMMTEYVSQPNPEDRSFPGYDAYMAGLAQYENTYCTADDRDHYYDFRGDSNLKPNSPESNGMIWYSTSMMNRCRRDSKTGKVSVANSRSTGKPLDFSVAQCEKYMSKPFASRWNAARSALTTWIMRNQKFDPEFSNTSDLVSIIPGYNPELLPASFKFYGGEVYKGSDETNFMANYSANVGANWPSADAGFTSVFGFNHGGVAEIDYAYERIKDAVDRHTDWYASGYNDSFFEPEEARVIDQAYSPFVASSYEMSESDAFTAPGITVNGPVDGRRQWMFVFKVHKSKWYNTDSLANGEPVNFETQWFDETSFGTTHLADSERAWDRLGTPLEGEMESMLYLHNIKNDGYPIKSMYSADQYPEVVDDGLGETK